MQSFTKLPFVSSLFPILAATALAVPAFAGVTVNSPYNAASVGAPFTLSADSPSCSSQSVSAMGYSLDSSSETTVINSTSISTAVTASTGTHTLHVKSWGSGGASCVTDVTITVTTAVAAAPNAIENSSVQALGSWVGGADSATGSGKASGSMSLTNSPSRSGNARRFVTTTSGFGGERYDISFGDDTESENFLYDGWVYIASPNTDVANIEMDMNQTMANGETVIFGFQCDGWNGTWDYTANTGTATKPVDTWVKSSQGCNPRNWAVNTWHHVQIAYSRTSAGMVTYKTVTLDGNTQTINKTVSSVFALGWGPALLTNFQVDGYLSGTGTSTVYLDQLTISRW